MRAAPLGLACLVLLAGCSDGGTTDDPTVDFSDLELEATSTTGIIRGVVVDDAIRPIVGAKVTLNVGTPLEQTTGDDGVFGFDALEPGTYFLNVEKLGFLSAQQSVDVVAGVAEPPIAKVLLVTDSAFVPPYVEVFLLDGYIECGVTTSAVAYAVCSQPNGCQPGFGVCLANTTVTNDNFNMFVPVSGVPSHVQHEVVWEATQSTGNMFNMAMRTAFADQFYAGGYEADIGGDIIGTSPLVGIINATMIEDAEIGKEGLGLAPAVFAGGMEGTAPCIPDPVPQVGGACLFANGATVEQRFKMYTHVFYGYVPPEGWQFSIAGEVPPPPA